MVVPEKNIGKTACRPEPRIQPRRQPGEDRDGTDSILLGGPQRRKFGEPRLVLMLEGYHRATVLHDHAPAIDGNVHPIGFREVLNTNRHVSAQHLGCGLEVRGHGTITLQPFQRLQHDPGTTLFHREVAERFNPGQGATGNPHDDRYPTTDGLGGMANHRLSFASVMRLASPMTPSRATPLAPQAR